MPSIFSKILSGEIPCYKIAEDDDFLAFLDIAPLREGHVLIVPKIEIDKFFSLSDGLLSKWLLFAKPIAKSIEHNFDCNRCGLSVIGLEVPHAHMHLVPINSAADLDFTQTKLALSQDRMKEIQLKIVNGLH